MSGGPIPTITGPTFEPTTVQGVVFDIGGVFSYPAPGPVAECLTALDLAAPARPERFRRAHHAGVRALTDAMVASGNPDETRAEFWVGYDHAYAADLDVPPEHRDEVAAATRQAWDWAHDDNITAFHHLAATGIPVAVVSNNSGTAAEQLVQHGVCQVGPGPLPEVAIVVDSTLEGVAKPDPAIFNPALDALGLDPAAVLYVGDTVHADVWGATRAGMQVVQLDPFDQHADFAHSRARDLRQVWAMLAR